ncbi:MAG: hypothetical protein MUF22_00870 [Chitinispirillaceae bacterium]|jgi:hypothetical protein|nr:hypothetical protein [Chitinispirillaceae bacterium]
MKITKSFFLVVSCAAMPGILRDGVTATVAVEVVEPEDDVFCVSVAVGCLKTVTVWFVYASGLI